MPATPDPTRRRRALRASIPLLAALAIGATASVTAVRPAGAADAAYAPRVVIVVGPAGSATSDYLSHARAYARQARAYGASVKEVYTPHATWAKVLGAAQGANVFIYLGHGNGWPSPYAPFQTRTKNGLGLNPYDGAGNGRVTYYGEARVAASIRLAPGAIVLLNRLCYASGNGEPGMAEPSWTTAVKRVDNYGAGFLRTGADAVLADGHTSLGYELATIFDVARPVYDAWAKDPDANGHVRSFDSVRTPGTRAHLDPDRTAAAFYRSLAVRPGASTGAIHIVAFSGATRTRAALRTSPGGEVSGAVPEGQRVFVRASLRLDAKDLTWTPVTTRTGRTGWIAGTALAFAGSARARTAVVLRARPSLRGARRAVVKENVRVRVVGSARDGAWHTWLKVVTPRGRTGWIAAWLTKP